MLTISRRSLLLCMDGSEHRPTEGQTPRRGLHWPVSSHPPGAVPWRLSCPRKLVSAAQGHAQSSGCKVPPLQGESWLSVTHTSVTEPTPLLPKTSFSLPVTRGHRDNSTEQLGQLTGTICGKPSARRLAHRFHQLMLLSEPEKGTGSPSSSGHMRGETCVTRGVLTPRF